MILDTTQFTRYKISEIETLTGSVLTESQLMLVSNQLADAAEQRLALDFDPTNMIKFAQDEAFLKGQISILTMMLEAHKVAQETLSFQSKQSQSQE
jgi:hypothetical protein